MRARPSVPSSAGGFLSRVLTPAAAPGCRRMGRGRGGALLCLRETPVWESGLRQPPAFPRLFFLRPLELLLGIALHIYVAVCSRPSPRNGIAPIPPFPVVPLHGERLTGGCQTLMLRAPESVPPLAGAIIFISLEYTARSPIAQLNCNFAFNFLRNCLTVFTVATSFYTYTSNVRGFQFLHIPSNKYLFFIISICIHVDLILDFPDD